MNVMNFDEYYDAVKDVPDTDSLKYDLAIMWLNRALLPLKVVSVGNASGVIKIPSRTVNEYGRSVPVVAIGKDAFANHSNITDIILPHSIESLPAGAFRGCSELRGITIPRKIHTIREGTFADCDKLENVYYEGTAEEWNRLVIVHQKHEIEFGNTIPGTPVCEIKGERLLHIPGNDALFTANIHFNCVLPGKSGGSTFKISIGGKDATDLFKTM